MCSWLWKINRYIENHLINGMSRTTGGSLLHALGSWGEKWETPLNISLIYFHFHLSQTTKRLQQAKLGGRGCEKMLTVNMFLLNLWKYLRFYTFCTLDLCDTGHIKMDMKSHLPGNLIFSIWCFRGGGLHIFCLFFHFPVCPSICAPVCLNVCNIQWGVVILQCCCIVRFVEFMLITFW